MTFYNSDIVKVNDYLYDSVDTALAYIKENWISELDIGFFSSEDVDLLSVEYGSTGIVVKYLVVDYYDEQDRQVMKEIEEILEVSYTSMMVTI